jgi:dihydrofolate reductase
MRKVILCVHTSLDGFMGGPEGGLDWVLDDIEADVEATDAIRGAADTIVLGRELYESFEGAWPARATDPSLTPELMTFAKWIVTTPTVVFSHGRPTLGMDNARLATEDLATEIAALREAPGPDGGDIVFFGGAGIVGQAVGLDLIDEYWLRVHPVVLGRGLPVFAAVEHPLDLVPAWSKVYPSGVTGVRYERRSSEGVVRSRYVRSPE